MDDVCLIIYINHTMKKLIVAIPALFVVAVAQAEDKTEPLIDRSLIFDIVNITGMLILLYLIFSFILDLLQRNLDHRIKTKVIESGTPEGIVSQLLAGKKKDVRRDMLQWVCVLLAIGTGLILIQGTKPYGLHSPAIMAFSIGAGLLAFYLISGRRKKDTI